MNLTNIKLNNKVITSKNKFTTLEIKVFLYLCKIYQIKETQQRDLFNNIIFNSKDIYNILEIDYKNLKRTFLSLKNNSIIINDDTKKTFTSLILKFTFFKNGIIEIFIDKELEELFKILKENYTILQEKETYKLNFKHSLKLYLHFKKIENQKYKRIIFTLTEINEMFNTNYVKYNHINNNILKSSISEINEKTDLNILYLPKKDEFNKIYAVVFDIIV